MAKSASDTGSMALRVLWTAGRIHLFIDIKEPSDFWFCQA